MVWTAREFALHCIATCSRFSLMPQHIPIDMKFSGQNRGDDAIAPAEATTADDLDGRIGTTEFLLKRV